MRARKPGPLAIGAHDRTILQAAVRSQTLPGYQLRRARTVLTIAAWQRTAAIASHVECDVGTIPRTSRRYRDGGVPGLVGEPQRAARPARISPLLRARIVKLACLEPVAKRLHITQWSSEDLAP
jgi:hypothetical protein